MERNAIEDATLSAIAHRLLASGETEAVGVLCSAPRVEVERSSGDTRERVSVVVTVEPSTSETMGAERIEALSASIEAAAAPAFALDPDAQEWGGVRVVVAQSKPSVRQATIEVASKDALTKAWLDSEIEAQLEKQLKQRWLQTATLFMTVVAAAVGALTSYVMTPTVMAQLGNDELDGLRAQAEAVEQQLIETRRKTEAAAELARIETLAARESLTQARRSLSSQVSALDEAFDRIAMVNEDLAPVEAGLAAQREAMATVVAQVEALQGAVQKLDQSEDPKEEIAKLTALAARAEERAANAQTRVSILYWRGSDKEAKRIKDALTKRGYVAWVLARGKSPPEGAAERVFFRKSSAPFKVTEAQRDEVAQVAGITAEYDGKQYLTSGDIQIQLASPPP